jgi:2-polyprenyl-3-methyl-5-hydroxy-6-metoxy-1,4-benzoquinol methylase
MIPTLNESKNLTSLFEKIDLELLSKFKKVSFLVIDDNSKDDPLAAIKRIRDKGFDIDFVSRPHKMGLGSAHRLGFRYFLNSDFTVFLTMDADLSHDPKMISVLISEIINGADIVIGSRWIEGGHCQYGLLRKSVSQVANRAARMIAAPGVNDSTSAFRSYNRKAIKHLIDGSQNLSDSYSFFLETAARFDQNSWSIKELPINFVDRQHGHSKIPRAQIFYSTITLLKLGINRLNSNPKPLQLEIKETCPICGSDEVEPKHNLESMPRSYEAMKSKENLMCIGDYRFRMPVLSCLRCAAKFSPPSTWSSLVESQYESIEDHEYLKYSKIKRKTFKEAFHIIQPYLRPESQLFEVGSYVGTFLGVLQENGYKASGIELSHWGVAICRKFGFAVDQVSIEEFLIRNEKQIKFDVITSWDVLEHVADPISILRGLGECLKPGGKIVISTLDSDSTFAKVMGGRWPWIIPMHLHYFGFNTLKNIFDQAGLEIVKHGNYGHYASVGYMLNKLLPSSFMKLWFPKQTIKLLEKIVLKLALGDVKYFVLQPKT